jgi:hypothetical protein
MTDPERSCLGCKHYWPDVKACNRYEKAIFLGQRIFRRCLWFKQAPVDEPVPGWLV